MKWYGATYNIDEVLQSLKLHEYSNVKVKKLEYDGYVFAKDSFGICAR